MFLTATAPMRRLSPLSVARSVLAPVLRPAAASAWSLAQFLDVLLDQLINEVVRRVDLDAAVRRVDLDAAVRRVDIEAILDRIDLTATVLDRVDLGIVVREAIAQLDEASVSVVVSRVDVDAVAQRLDIDAVAQRLDIEAVIDRLDLTAIVLRRVDLHAVVDAALAQVDMITLANEVIDGVDLPEIIRESTGSMASETVKGARMQGIGADQAVSRAMDRLLLRHGHTPTTPGDASP